MDYLQKPVSCSKYLVHLSKINICVNEHVSAIRMTSPCVIEDKTVKLLSHVVNITVYSLSITWCNYYMATVWMTVTVYWNSERLRFLCMTYIHFKSTKHFTVRGILIVRDCFEMFELLRIWSISQYLADWQHGPQQWPLFHLICASVLGLFCLFLCFASVPFHHASLLLFFLSAVDPDRFLDVHPLSEFVTLVLSSVYICFPIEGSWDAPLSYFRELVYTGWSIFSSLVKVKIHLDNSWQIYKKSKRNV